MPCAVAHVIVPPLLEKKIERGLVVMLSSRGEALSVSNEI